MTNTRTDRCIATVESKLNACNINYNIVCRHTGLIDIQHPTTGAWYIIMATTLTWRMRGDKTNRNVHKKWYPMNRSIESWIDHVLLEKHKDDDSANAMTPVQFEEFIDKNYDTVDYVVTDNPEEYELWVDGNQQPQNLVLNVRTLRWHNPTSPLGTRYSCKSVPEFIVKYLECDEMRKAVEGDRYGKCKGPDLAYHIFDHAATATLCGAYHNGKFIKARATSKKAALELLRNSKAKHNCQICSDLLQYKKAVPKTPKGGFKKVRPSRGPNMVLRAPITHINTPHAFSLDSNRTACGKRAHEVGYRTKDIDGVATVHTSTQSILDAMRHGKYTCEDCIAALVNSGGK